MKIFDKYFQPYSEYCIRTSFSEDELKGVLTKECPATGDILSWRAVKSFLGLNKTVVFSRNPDNSLQLSPIKYTRNTAECHVFIRCEKAANGETILHITIGPNGKYKYLAYGICLFALLWSVAASFVIWWGIFLAIPFIGLFFIILELCRASAMDEVPKTRQDFELMLRALESKYRQENE